MTHAPPPDSHAVTTEAELEELIGSANERVKIKLRTEIDDTAREFIERSPFIVVATCDAEGRLDASPKGDPPGFVHVIDPTTLAIPERKGNALGFGPRSILATGRIGLIFMVPGQRESYRVNGTAGPIASQIGALLGDENLVPVVAADLEQNYRDELY